MAQVRMRKLESQGPAGAGRCRRIARRRTGGRDERGRAPCRRRRCAAHLRGPARGSLGSNLTVNKLGGSSQFRTSACRLRPRRSCRRSYPLGRHRVCILGPYLSPLCKGRRESNRDPRRVDEACNGWPTCRVVARGKVGRRTKVLVQKPRRDGGLCSCCFSGHTASEHLSSKWSCAP
jgi:hypothetical protein